MTTLKPNIQRPAPRLLGGREIAAPAPHEHLAQDLRAKLGREGALRACRANGWAGALTVLLAEEVPDKAAA
ncbi:MAG: hypothetical protein QNJ30_03350 [Kiloniellales bacterium]|nr:hypothetical protein [Kiloniellales bacterium]